MSLNIDDHAHRVFLPHAVLNGTVPEIWHETKDLWLVKEIWYTDWMMVSDVDTSALALILAWLRRSRLSQGELCLCHLPEKLISLIQAFGLQSMLLEIMHDNSRFSQESASKSLPSSNGEREQ